MTSAARVQTKALRHILEANKNSSLAANFGLSSVAKFKDEAQLYAAFTKNVPLQQPEAWPQMIRHMSRNNISPLLDIITQPNVFGKTAAQGLVQLSKDGQPLLAPAVGKQIGKFKQTLFQACGGKKAFCVFDFYTPQSLVENATTENQTLLPPLLYPEKEHIASLGGIQQLLTKILPKLAPFTLVNDIKRLLQEGRSQHQLFYTLYRQAKLDGKDVEVLVAHPRVLQSFVLFMAQQEGKFVPLKQLFPNLKAYAPTVVNLSPYEISLSYCFNGLNIQTQSCCTEGLVPAWQINAQVPHMLEGLPQETFYEFIRQEDIRPDGTLEAQYTPLRLQDTIIGGTYLLILSTPNGLLRQNTGWLVTIQSHAPLHFKWNGYLQPLNGFGEVLPHMLCLETVNEINELIHSHNLFIRDVCFGVNREKHCHEWVLELSRPVATADEKTLLMLARRLHNELQMKHEPYRAALRKGAMQVPHIHFVSLGTFSLISGADKANLRHGIQDTSPEYNVIQAILELAQQQKISINPLELSA